MPLSLNIGKCTLLGNYRENNEDAIDVKQFPEMTVCIVADGMGGQQAGEVASKIGVETILSIYYGEASEDRAHVLEQAFEQANQQIYARGNGP
jgi:protein phosphatase